MKLSDQTKKQEKDYSFHVKSYISQLVTVNLFPMNPFIDNPIE